MTRADLWIDRAVRAAMRLAPKHVRRDWGHGPAITIRALCREAYEHTGWRGLLVTAVTELMNLVIFSTREPARAASRIALLGE